MRSFIIILTAICLHAAFSCKQKKEKGMVDEFDKYATVERYPLPYPDKIKRMAKNTSLKQLSDERDSLLTKIVNLSVESAGDTIPEIQLDSLYTALSVNTDMIAYVRASICMGEDDSKPVEEYTGNLGVSQQLVAQLQTSVGQIQWRYDFGNQFIGPNSSEGDVKGVRWCTGTLIGKDTFITAGHCFSQTPRNRKVPMKNGKTISSAEMAKLMRVNFNYQYSGTSGKLRSDTIDYPVLELLEIGNDSGVDYAIIKLGKDNMGKLPGERFGAIPISNLPAAVLEMLVVIQHPDGDPKVVETGPVSSLTTGWINYNDIDTRSGSSGSALISAVNGKIVGVHTDGGCDTRRDGHNHGVPIGVMLPFSPILRKIAH